MHKLGPRNISLLNLMRYQFPLPALVSILHRLSGLLLVLSIPGVLWLLQFSLHSAETFEMLRMVFKCLWVKSVLWFVLSALMYHVIAGIRHLIMDFGFFETKLGARCASLGVLALSLGVSIFLGVWLW